MNGRLTGVLVAAAELLAAGLSTGARIYYLLAAALLAIVMSCVLFALGVSSGISIILCTVAASAVMALLHPVEGGEQA